MSPVVVYATRLAWECAKASDDTCDGQTHVLTQSGYVFITRDEFGCVNRTLEYVAKEMRRTLTAR